MADSSMFNDVIEGQISKPQPMALEGIKVVDLTIVGAGPIATRLLGQLGAEIFKIEMPGAGDEHRSRNFRVSFGVAVPEDAVQNPMFEDANQNKKSVTIDLHDKRGQEILYELVAKSDVFTTNLRPSALKRMNVDYETLVKHNPRIVYARGNLFGPKGPDVNKPGYASHGNAVGGLMTLHGYMDSIGPMDCTSAAGDTLHALAMAYGVLAGLMARDRLGIGQEITLSQLGVIMNLLISNNVAQELAWGTSIKSKKREEMSALMNSYKCKDDKWILMAWAIKPRFEEWHPFCVALGRPELETDPRFKDVESQKQNNAELRKILEDTFITRTRAEWDRIFREAGVVWYCPVNKVSEIPDDPHVLANNYVWDVNHPKYGKMKLPGHPVTFTKTPATLRTFAPEVGQDTDAVLSEMLGYGADRLARLREDKVI